MALTPKGAARRDSLLSAALHIIEVEGPAAVTHRSVAKEAGVPLAAATYYFASIDDLLVSAMKVATHQQTELFTTLSAGDIAAFAAELWSWIYESRALAISQGDVSTLWSEPVAIGVYVVMGLLLLAMVIGGLRKPSPGLPTRADSPDLMEV